MARIIRGGLALSLLVVVAACNRAAPVEEYVAPAVQPALTLEPVFTGKYN